VEGDGAEKNGPSGGNAENEGDDRSHDRRGHQRHTNTVEGAEHAFRIRRARGSPMRRAAGLLSAVLAVTACTAGFTPSETAPTVPTTSTTVPSTTTTTEPATTTTTTTVDPGPPLGLITPNGIPVAIRLVLPEGYLVWTPCGETARVSGGEPLWQTPVVLDPGHGGNRSIGAQGRNGLPEKVVNLQVAMAAKAELEARGIPTVLTRVDEYATTLRARSQLADLLQASALVSIHHNAPTPGPSPTPGTEIFYQSRSAESRRLGGVLYEHVFHALSQFTEVQWTAAPDAGVITVLNSRGTDAYGMIRIPETPSVLLELGYISNPSEAELFATEEYVEVAGRAIADALETYLDTDDPGMGWYEPGRVFDPAPGLSQAACVEVPLE
jgi:N-acetylmuramoyl-L-alanine amidase